MKLKKYYNKIKKNKKIIYILNYITVLFFSALKYLIEWFILFVIVIIIYWIINWIRWNRNTDEDIINKIKKDLPTSNINIRFLKTDLKWFWNDSLIVFTSYPNENWKEDWKRIDYEYKYYPQILIYDKIQKSFLERIIFEWDLYEKVFDLQLAAWHEDNNKLNWNIPFYTLENASPFSIWENDFIYFERTDANQGNTRPILRWLLWYEIGKWFYIKPLLEWINRLSIEDEYNEWEIELFDNITHNAYINNKLNWITLSLNISDDYFKFSGDNLFVDYSLFWYNKTKRESHSDCHDRAIIKFTKNPNWYFSKDRNLWFNYNKVEKYIHNIEKWCTIYYSELFD